MVECVSCSRLWNSFVPGPIWVQNVYVGLTNKSPHLHWIFLHIMQVESHHARSYLS
jgi:hypothetical protein